MSDNQYSMIINLPNLSRQNSFRAQSGTQSVSVNILILEVIYSSKCCQKPVFISELMAHNLSFLLIKAGEKKFKVETKHKSIIL